MKNIFEVSVEERNRILLLHETATKKQYLSKSDDKIYPKKKLGDKFTYGKYESESVKNEIINLKPSIEDFIKNSKNSKFIVKILAGESQVTNPEGFEQKGSLALRRAQEVAKYFNEIFPDLISSGVLTIETPTIDQVKIGETDYDKNKGDAKNKEKIKKYNEEQFVDFYIEGVGEIEPKKPNKPDTFNCRFEKPEGQGKFLPSSSNFSQVVDWNIGEGEGTFYLWFETLDVPDIIFFEYNGVQYGKKMFSGNDADPFRIMVGTSLRAKFGDSSSLPTDFFGKTTFEPLSINNSADYSLIFNSLPEMKRWYIYETFSNTFGSGQEFFNQSYMDALKEYDDYKDGKRERKKLIDSLGPNFPWGRLTSPMGPSTQKNIGGPIKKIRGLNTIKLFNVAPCGITGWACGGTCKPF